MKIQIFDKTLEKFIKSLEKPTIAKLLRIIDLLEAFGHRLSMPHSRKVSDKLFELRVKGKQEARIFYTFHQSSIILLHGFVKKTQKISVKEMRAALQKLKQFDTI